MQVSEEQMLYKIGAVHRTRTCSSENSDSPSGSYIGPGVSPVFTGLAAVRANSGSYFNALAQLSNITQNIIVSFYSTSAATRSLNEMLQDMSRLSMRLNQWVIELPVEFDFRNELDPSGPSFLRERMILGFQLCSARMLLTHPCYRDQVSFRTEDNEGISSRFISRSCIEAAKTMVGFLPDRPDPSFIYNQGPWWCIVHHIMQALSVLLLGLSSTSYTTEVTFELAGCLEKIVRWLRSMPDPMAQRAYHIALRASEGVVRRLSLEISN
jgi:hypothetical protein